MKKEEPRYIVIRILRFCLALSLFLSVSVLADRVFLFSLGILKYPIQLWVVLAVRIVLTLLVYYSALRSFLITDLAILDQYITNGNAEHNRMWCIASSPTFIICWIGTALFAWFFSEMCGALALSQFTPFSKDTCKWFLSGVYVLIMPISLFSAMKEWQTTPPIKTRREAFLSLLGNVGWTFAAYLGIAFIFPQILPAVYSTGRLLQILGFKTLWIAITVILIIFFAIGLRAVCIRRRFVRNLRKTAEANGWRLSRIKYPYLSLFLDSHGCSFSLKANGKTYTCKLLAGIRRGNAIRFLENGECRIIRRVRMRHIVEDLMQFHTQFPYAFEGEGKKVLILSPTPYKIFVAGGKQNHAIDIGDNVGEYMIYTGTSFINAVSRNSI